MALSFGLSVLVLKPLAVCLARLGVDSARFLDRIGVDEAAGPDAFVPADRVDRALQEIADARNDPHLGLTLAQTEFERPFGFFGQLVWANATLRDALTRAGRYYALVSQRAVPRLEERAGDALARLTIFGVPGAARNTILVEYVFATIVLHARQSAGPAFAPHAVHFVHPATDGRAHAKIFGVTPTFGEREDRLVFRRAQLDLVLSSADPVIASALEAHAARICAIARSGDDFRDEVRAAVARGLGTHGGRLDRLARDLRISTRTLQRRLQEIGTSHRELVDDVRREIAVRLVLGDASAIEAAHAVGFASGKAFRAAFTRWTGDTLAGFRARNPAPR